jgi:hypothetical protein
MARYRRLWFVTFLIVMLAATPAFASGKFFHSFRGGHGFPHGFHRHHPHVGRHFSFGVPHHQRFDRQFGFHRHPKSFHTPFQHHHFSPHLWRR